MFDYADFVSRIDEALVLARYWNRLSGINITAARYEWGLGNYNDCLFEVMGAVDYVYRAVDYLAPYKNLLYGLWNLERLGDGLLDDFTNLCGGGEYELTMNDILSVMLSATDEEYTKFIGLVDAYRIGLWNKPFNSEYYAALGRGFTT